MFEIKGKYTSAKVFTENAEEQCVSQVNTMVNHPAFTEPVAIMPDCHAGKGSVIGFTMPLSDRVIPNVIGVDIGCGMLAVKIKKPDNLDLARIDKEIRNRVPFGQSVRASGRHKSYELKTGSKFYDDAQSIMNQFWVNLRDKFGRDIPNAPVLSHHWFMEKCDQVGQDYGRAQASIGTLGGGNHFIEVGESSLHSNYLWIIVHSGSRQLGKNICDYHQGIAVEELKKVTEGDYQSLIEEVKRTSKPKDIQKNIEALRAKFGVASGIKQKGLESLSGNQMFDYLYDMMFAQQYASLNRHIIMTEVLHAFPQSNKHAKFFPGYPKVPIFEEIETVHNYVNPNDLVIRKGAVSSSLSEKIVIPFNMKDGTWICKGKSNEGWNNSAPHGAGRIMSRSKAKEVLSKEDAKEQMEGIYTSVLPLDEAPGAYKPADEIKDAIRPTAELLEEVKPILNMKAN